MISVNVWDKGLVVSVEKAIRNSGLGLNPVTDGTTLRVPIPPLTEERRKDLAKQARKVGEECKIAVREARREAKEMIDSLVDDGDVGQDEGDLAWKKAEEIVAGGNKQIDEIIATKEKDIMTV